MDMLGEDTIEKLLKEKETIVLPNVTKYAKNSINEYFENEKVEILEELNAICKKKYDIIKEKYNARQYSEKLLYFRRCKSFIFCLF